MPPETRRELINGQLRRILASQSFVKAPSLSKLLNFLVSESLAGRSDQLKETVIGTAVFKKDADYDNSKDPIVRTTASRLRKQLREYYAGEGSADLCLIELPPDGYSPRFTPRPVRESPASDLEFETRSPERTETSPVSAIGAGGTSDNAPLIAATALPIPNAKPTPPTQKTFNKMLSYFLAFGVAVGLLSFWSRYDLRKPTIQNWGRLLVGATSENKLPERISLDQTIDMMAITPDGSTLFAGRYSSPSILAIHSLARGVTRIPLSSDTRSMVISPDGKRLYVGSRVDGVTVIDTATRRVVSRFSTQGEVFDLAITPDGKKLFLAMSQGGLWRMLTETGELEQVTKQACPVFLETGFGKLFVSYQCGGPGGRRAHDAMEIFSLDNQDHLATVGGPPMVGGPLTVSPDGDILVMDGQDACSAPQYSQSNSDCSQVPSWTLHFLRLTDFKLIKGLALPLGNYLTRFIDRDHVLLLGNSLKVMDAYRYSETERWEYKGTPLSGPAVDSERQVVYVGSATTNEILKFQAEDPACSPPSTGLVAFYSGDGVATNLAGGDALALAGDVQFGPGRVGQAFVLNGNSGYLIGPRTTDNPFGLRDSSFVAYVKFGDRNREMTIFDRTYPVTGVGVQLRTDSFNLISLDFRQLAGEAHLSSQAPVVPARWYQVAVTKGEHELALYLDGTLQSKIALSTGKFEGGWDPPLYLGADHTGHHLFQGKLDEILIYNRALRPKEVLELYQKRDNNGGCHL